MTLAKALKQKNRLTQKINNLKQEIQGENQARVDGSRKINVKELMVELEGKIEELIKLKTNIFVASASMRETILKLGELKSKIAFLRGINTGEGKISLYGDAEVEYSVVFDKVYIKEEVKKCEDEIDSLQDELDTFNHKTEITEIKV